jgi:hypothetical protein
MKSVLFRIIPIAALALIACGCEQKLTYERFQTIREGDPPEVVESTLGDPWMRGVGDQTWVYQDRHRRINASVYFQDAKVVAKKWSDPQRGIEGTSVVQPGESHQIEMREIK